MKIMSNFMVFSVETLQAMGTSVWETLALKFGSSIPPAVPLTCRKILCKSLTFSGGSVLLLQSRNNDSFQLCLHSSD